MRPGSQHSSRNLERLESRPAYEVVPYLLKSLHHSLRQTIDERLRKARIEVSFAHVTVLFSLEEEPGVPGAELARRSYVTAQTMNTILHRLEADGLIERKPHPTSPRADSWFITRAGRAQLDAAKVVGRDIWRTLLGGLAPHEVSQLQGLLQKLLLQCGVSLKPQAQRGLNGTRVRGQSGRTSPPRKRASRRASGAPRSRG